MDTIPSYHVREISLTARRIILQEGERIDRAPDGSFHVSHPPGTLELDPQGVLDGQEAEEAAHAPVVERRALLDPLAEPLLPVSGRACLLLFLLFVGINGLALRCGLQPVDSLAGWIGDELGAGGLMAGVLLLAWWRQRLWWWWLVALLASVLVLASWV